MPIKALCGPEVQVACMHSNAYTFLVSYQWDPAKARANRAKHASVSPMRSVCSKTRVLSRGGSSADFGETATRKESRDYEEE